MPDNLASNMAINSAQGSRLEPAFHPRPVVGSKDGLFSDSVLSGVSGEGRHSPELHLGPLEQPPDGSRTGKHFGFVSGAIMETWLSAILGGIGVAIIGVLGNALLEWQRRKKTAAEARVISADYTVKVTERYDKLAERLGQQVDELTKRLQVIDIEREAEHTARDTEHKLFLALQSEVEKLRAEVAVLKATNAELQKTNTELQSTVTKLEGIAKRRQRAEKVQAK